MKTENMSWEVLQAIKDCFNDGTDESNELIAMSCKYLYDTTTDDKMKAQCIDIMNELNYCIDCGTKMTYYKWTEARPLGEETMSVYDCPCCSDMERGDC